MYVYMGHLKFEHTKPYEDWFWKKNKIDLVFDHVIEVTPSSKSVALNSGKKIDYHVLIIATGSTSNKFGWIGQDLPGVQGLYGYNDLQLMEANTTGINHAVIVGGGLIGVEMAEMLLSRKIGVTFLVREPEFWSVALPLKEANMISRHIRSHGVNLKLSTELKEIQSGSNGKVGAVITNKDENIECQFVGLAVGVSPNISFLKDSGVKTGKGVIVDEYLTTNIEGIYAIGDCVERSYPLPGRKAIEQVWYTGRMMGEVVAQTICGHPTKYEPGPWFNSAKFFDIEFQTYGTVNAERGPDEEDFYWEHASGKKAMHFIWNTRTREFLGINTFGIRLRHECFDRWLREKRDIQYVLQHLPQANFDPEFYHRHEAEITKEFYNSHPALKAA